jgi:hypothetical protein
MVANFPEEEAMGHTKLVIGTTNRRSPTAPGYVVRARRTPIRPHLIHAAKRAGDRALRARRLGDDESEAAQNPRDQRTRLDAKSTE